MKQRMSLTIDQEIYYELVRQNILQNQIFSSIVNNLLKKYLETNPKYENTINELNKEIKKLRERHMNEIAKEIKDLENEKQDEKEQQTINKSKVRSIKMSGVLNDL